MTADEVTDLLVAAMEREWDRLFPHKAFPALDLDIWSTLLQDDDFFYEGEVEVGKGRE